MRELRNGEAAAVELDRGLGPRTAEARRPCVEKSFNGVGGVIVGGQLVAGVQKLRQSDEPRNARRLSQELVAPGGPEAQGALTGVVADAQEEVEVVQLTGNASFITGSRSFGLADEVAAPAVRRAVSEGSNEPGLVLSTGHQAQGWVDVHPTVGKVGGVIEKGGGDLAARSGDVRLADQAVGAVGI